MKTNKTAIVIAGIVVLGAVVIAGMYLSVNYGSDTDAEPDTDTIAVSTPPSEQKTTPIIQNTKETRRAEGTISMQGGQFVLSGDSQFQSGLRVKNSANVKLGAILQIYVDNKKKVALEGIVESKAPSEMIVLRVAGQQVLTEANAMDTTPRQEDTEVEAFSVFYAKLSQKEKNCLVEVFGQTKIQAWARDSSLKPSSDELHKIAACTK